MNYKWKFEPHTEEQREAAAKLSDELNISPIIARMLIKRGISDVQSAKKYFRPQLHDLHDPFLMKDMDKAFTSSMKFDKIRIAKSITPSAIINGTQTGLHPDNAMNNTLISLLLAGNTNCSGEDFSGIGSIFDQQIKDEELRKKKAEAEAAINAEAEAVKTVGTAVDTMRAQINNVTAARTSLNENRKDKQTRVKAENLCEQAFSAITEEYRNCIKLLEDKDKHKITVKEAADIESILKKEVALLRELIAKVKSENSLGGRFKKLLNDLMEDDN